MTTTTATTPAYDTPAARPGKAAVWTGRVLSGLIVAAMLFAGGMSIAKPPMVVENTVKAGYPESAIRPIGVAAVTAALLYAFPQTAVLGAILLTGYFGGAIATHVRAGEPWFIAAGFGVLTWLALVLRDPRLRRLLPLRTR